MRKVWFGILVLGLILSAIPSNATSPREELFARIVAETSQTVDEPARSVTPCIDGTAAGYPCENVNLMSFLPLGSIGGGSGNDIWGWTDPDTGKEYALMGRTSGTSFVDVTDPENPVYLGNLPTHTVSSTWRDIKVFSNHAFIVSEANNHGMQIFDLTQLRDVTDPPVTFSNTAHYDGFGSSHNLVINEDSGHAFSVGDNTCSGGLHIVNINNPTSPTFQSCFSADGYTHDAQCVIYNGPDADYQGHEVCFNSNEDTLTIVNLKDPRSPTLISRTSYSGAAYTHQGWLTADHTYFLLDDELDEQSSGDDTTTYIWDVSDLDNPINTGQYESGNPAIDHNLYIHEGLVYQSNYTSGLRILSTANIADAELEELAFFDVYPQHNNATFSGTWSNYPYFASGNVIVSSIDRGLFVLRPTLEPSFNMQVTPSNVTICTPDSTTVNVAIGSVLGFEDDVALSISGLPADTTGVFTPAVIAPNTTSTLNLTSDVAATDTSTVTIQGTADTISKTIDFTLNRLETPTLPQLQSPAVGATNQPPRPVLNWTDSGGLSYRLEMATDSDFTENLKTYTLDDSTFQPYVSLEPSTTYYWRVRAINVCGESAYTEGQFTTAAEPIATGDAEVASSADFETDQGGWTGASWSRTDEAAHTGDYSMYAAGSFGSTQRNLFSETYTLPTDKPDMRLNFWHRYELQQSVEGCMDGGVLQISVNGGLWHTLNSELYGDSYTDAIKSETSPFDLNSGAWCGDSQGWRFVSADLSEFAGSDVRFRFRLGNDGSVLSDGWYVDDIQLSYYSGERQIFLPILMDN